MITTFAFALLAICYVMRKCVFHAKVADVSIESKPMFHKTLDEIGLLSGEGSERFGAYLTANDFDFAKSKQEMEGISPENGVHIGCAAWHNFDIMCVRRPKFCVIIDYGTNNKKFIELTQELIIQSPNRRDFVEKLVEGLKHSQIKVGEDLFDRDPEERIRNQLDQSDSWLGSEDSFSYIRNLFREGKIAAINLDFTQEEEFKKIHVILQKGKLKVDSLYLCNVRYFIKESRQQLFVNSIKHIIDDETFVVHCPHILNILEENQAKDALEFPVKFHANSRVQCVSKGKDLKANQALFFVRYAKNPADKNRIDP